MFGILTLLLFEGTKNLALDISFDIQIFLNDWTPLSKVTPFYSNFGPLFRFDNKFIEPCLTSHLPPQNNPTDDVSQIQSGEISRTFLII